jgi:hypothetical protein
MIAGNPKPWGGTRLLACLFILILILTILLLRARRTTPSTPSTDPPLHPSVFVELSSTN